MGVTHIIGGAATWAAVAAAWRLGDGPAAIGAAVAGVSALVPDIGQGNSLAARSLGPVTGIPSWIIRHGPGGEDHRKGWLHAFAGMIIWSGACAGGWAAARAYVQAHHALSGPLPVWLLAAAVLGYVSHVVLDLMTLSGCCLLWPDLRVFHLLPYGMRVETGLQKKRLKLPSGRRTREKHHTAEWWVVRPVLVIILTGMSYLVAIGR